MIHMPPTVVPYIKPILEHDEIWGMMRQLTPLVVYTAYSSHLLGTPPPPLTVATRNVSPSLQKHRCRRRGP
jgi:hypothetical protein